MFFDIDAGSIVFIVAGTFAFVIAFEIAVRRTPSVDFISISPERKRLQGHLRTGFYGLLTLFISFFAFSGGLSNAGKALNGPGEIVGEPGTLTHTPAPRPDVTTEGRDLQTESINALDDFRQGFFNTPEETPQ